MVFGRDDYIGPPEQNVDISRMQTRDFAIQQALQNLKIPQPTGFVSSLNGQTGTVSITAGQGVQVSAGGGSVTVQADQTIWTSWTPTLTPGAGALTTTTIVAVYKVIGKTVHIRGTITITNVGTATGSLDVSLPVNAKDANFAVAGAEQASKKALAGWASAASTIRLNLYDGTTALATNNVLAFGGVYESA